MTERKKQIIALTICTSMLFGLTGCKKNSLKTKIDENTKQATLAGNINSNAIKDCYLVEIVGVDGKSNLYLAYATTNLDGHTFDDKRLIIVGTDIEIADTRHDLDEYNSDYGKVKNIYPFSYFISTYSEIKENYTGSEIEEVLNKVKDNYDEIKDKKEVKKLELKNNGK